MKSYAISGRTFAGEIQLFFLEEKLIRIDLVNCTLTDFQKETLLKIIAVEEKKIEEMMSHMKGCIIVSDDYSVSLDDFKQNYPYARNSHLLPPIWDRLSVADKVLAWLRAGDYARYCKRNDWYKPKIAAKWLKDREWLNDWNKM